MASLVPMLISSYKREPGYEATTQPGYEATTRPGNEANMYYPRS